jgi:hypothetical protein
MYGMRMHTSTTIDVSFSHRFFAQPLSRKTQKRITKRDREQLSLCHSIVRIRNDMAEKREYTLEAIDDVDMIILF